MPLNDLIVNGLKHETRHSEKGKKISLTPKSGEVILFLEIDNEDCLTRDRIVEFKEKEFPIEEGAVCDLLIIYSKKSLDNKLFMLVELKGDTTEEFKRGIRQILATHTYLERELKSKLGKIYSRIKWIGIIVSRGSSPKKVKPELKKKSSQMPIILISEPKANDKIVRQNVKQIYGNLM